MFPPIRTLNEWISKQVLAANGISVPKQRLVTTLGEAVHAADSIGYPVVLKRVTDIHKSDAGGVRVGLNTSADLTDAMREMLTRRTSASHASEHGHNPAVTNSRT